MARLRGPRIQDDDEATEFVREAIRGAWWDVLYHQPELPGAHKKLAIVMAAFERAGFVAKDEDQEEIDEDEIDTVDDYISNLIGSARGSIRHHEDGLKQAHIALAGAKAVIATGAFPQIDLEQIRTEQAERLRKAFDRE